MTHVVLFLPENQSSALKQPKKYLANDVVTVDGAINELVVNKLCACILRYVFLERGDVRQTHQTLNCFYSILQFFICQLYVLVTKYREFMTLYPFIQTGVWYW